MNYTFGTDLVFKASGGDATFNPGGGAAWANGTAWMSQALQLPLTKLQYQVKSKYSTGTTAPLDGEAVYFYLVAGSDATTFFHTGITGTAGQYGAADDGRF